MDVTAIIIIIKRIIILEFLDKIYLNDSVITKSFKVQSK